MSRRSRPLRGLLPSCCLGARRPLPVGWALSWTLYGSLALASFCLAGLTSVQAQEGLLPTPGVNTPAEFRSGEPQGVDHYQLHLQELAALRQLDREQALVDSQIRSFSPLTRNFDRINGYWIDSRPFLINAELARMQLQAAQIEGERLDLQRWSLMQSRSARRFQALYGDQQALGSD